ncbi:MAG: ribonuclease Z, partial [Desulfobacterales bacterium]
IKKEAVLSLGLQIGPWLKRFKNAILNQADLNEDFEVESVDNNSIKKRFQLGDLVDRIALITPGQKVTYISDVVYNRENADKIIDFAKESDHLFIEGAFLESHRDIAQKKFHLTAWQAGSIAGHARVKQFTLFHISPRYTGMASLFQKEAMTAYENASGRITKVTTLKKK